jgi:hypothetical protein
MVEGMPQALAELTFDVWRKAVALVWPGFDVCGCVHVPSSTSRVTDRGVPLSSASCHAYVHVDDLTDLRGAWDQACLRTLITEHDGTPLAFAKPKHSEATHEVIGYDWWTIWDRSTVTPSRLIFAGAPVVRGGGLKATEPVVRPLDGPDLARAAVTDLMPRKEVPAITEAIGQIRGHRSTLTLHRRSGVGRVTHVGVMTANLTMATVLITPTGQATVAALQAAKAPKTRCQSPFRESSSWAAFYNTYRDGTPFVFDSGTNETHTLNRDDLATMSEIIRDWLVEDYQLRFVCQDKRIFSDREGRPVRQRDIAPDDEIIDRMTRASDAPGDEQGRVKRGALPAQFRSWLSVAWGRLIRTLPAEDEVDGASLPAVEAFREQLAALLTSMYRTSLHGDGWRTFTKSLGSWAYAVAKLKPGEWQRLETFDLWSLIVDDGLLIALKPQLASEVRGHPEVAALSPNMLTRLCRKYGIAADGDNRIVCKGKQIRVTVLSAEFVASLDLSYDLDDALAATLKARMLEEESTPRSGSDRPPGRSVQ